VRRTPSVWPNNCPNLELGELVYSENMGAYSTASSTFFNGFPPAKVVHVNQ
jgi:ornithine decarboxylase